MGTLNDTRSKAGVAAGVVLVALGGWLLLRTTGIVPGFVFDLLDRIAWPLALIVTGAGLIFVAQRAKAPASGARLYRSRDDTWLGGVLAGIGDYLAVDATVLRIAFIVLASLGGLGGVLVPAYIVLWILVPEAPIGAVPAAADAAPVPPVPPAPPTEGA
ncbi:MAG: PspC domain-containing protein [Coriobacteriia bacterium]|nr:PspC domain-containing protein [Coriobacteriia bacterium]